MAIEPLAKLSSIVLTTLDYYKNNKSTADEGPADFFLNATLVWHPREIIDSLVTSGGRRMFREIGICNYTTLINSPPARGGLVYIIVVLAIFFTAASCICVPQGILNWFMWAVVFPIAVMWTAYGASPLCYPMVPPRLPSDIADAILRVLPGDSLPRFSVHENCTLKGYTLNGTYDAKSCFKQCDKPPFSMRSWQDTTAWWLCDISPSLARRAAKHLDFLHDFESSVAYFNEVISFGNVHDRDFVSAHRMCAAMTSHTIVFAAIGGAAVAIMIPPTIMAVAEIFAGAVGLLFEAVAAQQLLQQL